MWLSWMGITPCTEKLPVHFLLRVHARFQARSPVGRGCRRQTIDVCYHVHVSLSPPLPSCLTINKKSLTARKKEESSPVQVIWPISGAWAGWGMERDWLDDCWAFPSAVHWLPDQNSPRFWMLLTDMYSKVFTQT